MRRTEENSAAGNHHSNICTMKTASIFFCAMMALTSAADSSSSTCPDGWKKHNSSCLRYFPETLQFWQAVRCCNGFGGILASVPDSTAAGEIHALMESDKNKPEGVWVGGYYSIMTSKWSWVEWAYTKINPGKKFHDFCTKKTNPKCLQLTFTEKKDGCLQPSGCRSELPFVCALIHDS